MQGAYGCAARYAAPLRLCTSAVSELRSCAGGIRRRPVHAAGSALIKSCGKAVREAVREAVSYVLCCPEPGHCGAAGALLGSEAQPSAHLSSQSQQSAPCKRCLRARMLLCDSPSSNSDKAADCLAHEVTSPCPSFAAWSSDLKGCPQRVDRRRLTQQAVSKHFQF